MTLYVGEGLSGSNGARFTLLGFQSFTPLPTIKLGPSGAGSRVGGPVHTLGSPWVSPTTSPVRLGVSPAAAPTPTGAFNQRFEALSPHAGALGCAVCFAPSRSSHTLPVSVPPRPCKSSPPLLPVWMNVYFLFPWCRTSLLFDSLSVLVVRGGAVCLPTPPCWFSESRHFYVCRS